jgi:hypothetical protein
MCANTYVQFLIPKPTMTMGLLHSEGVDMMIHSVMMMAALHLLQDVKMVKMVQFLALIRLFKGDLRDVVLSNMPSLELRT